MRTIIAVTGIAMLIAGPSCWPADEPTKQDDAMFLREAASGGMLEVQLGQVAVKQANDSGIREFGERMVTDHSKINREVTALAGKKGVELPKSLNPKHQAMLDKLQALPRGEFDAAYIQAMVKDHEGDLKAFKDQAAHAQDEEVRALAQRTVPIITEHLKLAKQLAAKVEATRK